MKFCPKCTTKLRLKRIKGQHDVTIAYFCNNCGYSHKAGKTVTQVTEDELSNALPVKSCESYPTTLVPRFRAKATNHCPICHSYLEIIDKGLGIKPRFFVVCSKWKYCRYSESIDIGPSRLTWVPGYRPAGSYFPGSGLPGEPCPRCSSLNTSGQVLRIVGRGDLISTAWQCGFCSFAFEKMVR